MGEVQVDGADAIFGVPVSRTLGFERAPSWAEDGRPLHCWGSPGGGGVVTSVDPVARIGYAYVNNAAWAGPPGQDPRSANLTRSLLLFVADDAHHLEREPSRLDRCGWGCGASPARPAGTLRVGRVPA